MPDYSSYSLSFLLLLRDSAQISLLQSNSIFSRSETSMFQKFGTFALQKHSSLQQSPHGAAVCNSEKLPLGTEHFWEKAIVEPPL